MNRNVENWLRATLMVIGFIGGIGGVIYTMFKLYAMFPNGFRYGVTISIILTFVLAIIKFIKDELDAKDASEKYYRDTYPSYYKNKKEKDEL